MTLKINIKHHLEAQALLATRFAQDLEGPLDSGGFRCRVERFDDAPSEVYYTITPRDPLPEGMSVGETIQGVLQKFEHGLILPIYTGSQG